MAFDILCYCQTPEFSLGVSKPNCMQYATNVCNFWLNWSSDSQGNDGYVI